MCEKIATSWEHVRASWGLPNDVSINIDKSGIQEQWHYGVSYSLYFVNGKLAGRQSIQVGT